MTWWYVGAAAVSAAASLYGGSEAKKSAGKAASKQASAEAVVTQSKIQDLFKEEELMRGKTIAAAAGANVKTGVGSPLEILNEQAREFARERHVVSKVGATKTAAAKTRAQMVGDQAMYSGISQAASTAASAFAMFN